jgi:hypothetical protein
MTPIIWLTGRRNLRDTADALERHLDPPRTSAE